MRLGLKANSRWGVVWFDQGLSGLERVGLLISISLLGSDPRFVVQIIIYLKGYLGSHNLRLLWLEP